MEYGYKHFVGTMLGWLVGIAVAAAVVSVVQGVLIDGSGVHPSMGEHAGPPPTGTLKLDDASYIVADARSVHEVCPDGVDTVGGVPRGLHTEGIYLKCKFDQKWNMHQPPSPNFAQGWARGITSTWFVGLFAFALSAWAGIFLSLSACAGVSGVVHRRRDRKAQAARKQERLSAHDASLEALAVSFAKGEISDDQHDAAVARLLRRWDSGETGADDAR